MPESLGIRRLRPVQPLLASPARLQLTRQLVAALFTEMLVLRGVDGVGLREDLPCDLVVIAIGVMRRVSVHLRAIDGKRVPPPPGQRPRTTAARR